MAMATVNNGVNVQALLDAREALKGAPEAAKFTWRASCKWQNGTHSKTNVQGFFGLGQEQQHKTETLVRGRSPGDLRVGGQRHHPVEYVLVGLASCLTAGVAAVAQNRGIQLRSVESKLEGKMDIRGILGIDSDVRNGYDDIKVTFKIDADASKKEIEAHRRAVAEALGGLRRDHQPGERHRRSRLSGRDRPRRSEPSSASPRSSSGPGMPASRRAASSPSARSTTSCSSAARWRTPGAASAGTRCACSRPTGRAACPAIATTGRTPTAT